MLKRTMIAAGALVLSWMGSGLPSADATVQPEGNGFMIFGWAAEVRDYGSNTDTTHPVKTWGYILVGTWDGYYPIYLLRTSYNGLSPVSELRATRILATVGSSAGLEIHTLQQAVDRYVINANSVVIATPVAELVAELH